MSILPTPTTHEQFQALLETSSYEEFSLLCGTFGMEVVPKEVYEHALNDSRGIRFPYLCTFPGMAPKGI